ncbi:MAG: adenylate/guanylate cyclase domain-containing protein [Treponemataceae bacterium]|nr:adenylate/guanylate cyclase domain-containing protein [Treponemataceae bacterium]
MEFLRNHQLNIMLILIGICGILAFLVAISKSIPKSRKISLILIEVTALILIAADRYAYIYRGDVSRLGWWMVRISNFLVFFMSLFLVGAFNNYLIDLYTHEGGEKKVPKLLIIANCFVIAGMIILVIAQFFGFYYTFDEFNRYHRSKYMIFCYIMPVIIFTLELITIIKNFKKLRPKISIPILLFTILPIGATIVQLFSYGLSLTNMMIVWMAIVIYIFALQDLNESVERAHKLEIEILENYNEKLEKTVEERTFELKVANEKAENLLLNILPQDIAKELTENPGHTIANEYPNATVLFTDIVGFTKMSGSMSAKDTVDMLNKIVTLFDERAKREGIEKIKTIGDAYMAVTGLTQEKENDGAKRMIQFATGILEDVKNFNDNSAIKLNIRIGINSGNLVGGVIGKTKFIYDVWGDTVNVASRMESTGEAMKIHITESTYNQIKDEINISDSREMEVKGKGKMNTYFM